MNVRKSFRSCAKWHSISCRDIRRLNEYVAYALNVTSKFLFRKFRQRDVPSKTELKCVGCVVFVKHTNLILNESNNERISYFRQYTYHVVDSMGS